MADSLAGGFLARVHRAPAPPDRSSSVPPPDDLLLALSRASLRVFARKTRDLGCSCLSTAGDELLARGFHCPHLHGAADYWPTGLAVPAAHIRQVLVTYRTVDPAAAHTEETEASGSPRRPSSVAARTRDCVVVFSTDSAQLRRVRLEFEHNLARGVFVDAMTAATDGQVEVDYVDALDLEKEEEEEEEEEAGGQGSLSPRSSVGAGDSDERAFYERRAALRAVVAGKVSLALQISGEHEQSQSQTPGADPSVRLLLGSASAMAQALDEPDVLVLSWLVSGFINAQRALPSSRTSAKKAKKVAALALAQLRHASKLAREHCLPLLLSLSLQCSADLLVSASAGAVDVAEVIEDARSGAARGDTWRLDMARQWLVEAARLLPREVDAALKMQLHRKIADLSAIIAARFRDEACGGETDEASARSEREETVRGSYSDLTTRTLNLRTLLLDPVGRPTHQEQQQQQQQPQQLGGIAWLLSPPTKRADDQNKPTVCCVHVVNPLAASTTATAHGDAQIKQPDVQRVRVFFTSESDVEWLQNELSSRLRECPPPFLSPPHECRASSGSGNGLSLASESVSEVCALFDSADGWKRDARALSLATKLSAVVSSDGHVLTARVAPEAASKEEEKVQAALTVLCSQCHARVALEDAEAHSETCC